MADAVKDISAINQVFLAQGQQVATVGSLRGDGQAEQELGGETVYEIAISPGGGSTGFMITAMSMLRVGCRRREYDLIQSGSTGRVA